MDCADTRAWLARYEREKPPPETREAIARHAARCPSCAGDPRLVAIMPTEHYEDEVASAAGQPRASLSDAVYFFATKVIGVLAAIALAFSVYAGAGTAWRLSRPAPVPDDIRNLMAEPVRVPEEEDPEPSEVDRPDPTPLERLRSLAKEATEVALRDLGSLADISSRFRRRGTVEAIRRLAESGVLLPSRAIAVEACLLRLGGAGWDVEEWRKTLALMEMHEVMDALDKAVAAERREASR